MSAKILQFYCCGILIWATDAKRILSTLPPEDWRRPRGRPHITCLSIIHIPQFHTASSNGYGPEPVSVEDVVDVRHYAILSCMPETTTTTTLYI